MTKVAIVYWSNTGNTEAMADLIAQGAREAGATVQTFQAYDFDESKVEEFDAFAFGCPATGDEELEESEFLPMYDAVEPLLGEKPVVLFGSFSWNDGEWMETWENRADEAGLHVVDTVAARDYPDEEATADCVRVGKALA